jgi:hypothetical protein
MSWKGLWKPNGFYRTLSRIGLAVSYGIQTTCAVASAGKPAEACAAWSGRRGSNPRRPAWENGRRLIIKNLGVYSAESRLYGITIFFEMVGDSLLMEYSAVQKLVLTEFAGCVGINTYFKMGI